jgi:hypothetical protein
MGWGALSYAGRVFRGMYPVPIGYDSNEEIT